MNYNNKRLNFKEPTTKYVNDLYMHRKFKQSNKCKKNLNSLKSALPVFFVYNKLGNLLEFRIHMCVYYLCYK